MIQVAPNINNRPSLNYDDALLYCSLLDIDGYQDWRLPTTDEMKILKQDNVFDRASYNWTSDHHDDNSSYAMNLIGTCKISSEYWKHNVIAVRNS